jgi:hypothetical protein
MVEDNKNDIRVESRIAEPLKVIEEPGGHVLVLDINQ